MCYLCFQNNESNKAQISFLFSFKIKKCLKSPPFPLIGFQPFLHSQKALTSFLSHLTSNFPYSTHQTYMCVPFKDKRKKPLHICWHRYHFFRVSDTVPYIWPFFFILYYFKRYYSSLFRMCIQNKKKKTWSEEEDGKRGKTMKRELRLLCGTIGIEKKGERHIKRRKEKKKRVGKEKEI